MGISEEREGIVTAREEDVDPLDALGPGRRAGGAFEPSLREADEAGAVLTEQW